MATKLFGIDVRKWILGTSKKMAVAGSTESKDWRRFWRDTYQELGGRSTSGEKGCPGAGAYGLWFVGRVAETGRRHLDWRVAQVAEQLGKNAAYAVIAADSCRLNPDLTAGERWESVRQTYRRDTGEEAARSNQGAVNVAVALFAEGLLW